MKKIALILALALATPAAADPLVKCIGGCPSSGAKLRADSQVADAWWIGPSLGLSLAARDSSTKVWETGLAFAFSYGVKWRPTWSPTPTFLSFDLGLSAGSINAFSGGGTYDITLAPTITLLDIIAVGYGPRFKFASSTGGTDKVSGVFFLGLSTSFGSI